LYGITSIEFYKGLYVCAGQNGTVLTSADCKTWTKKQLDTVDLNDTKDTDGYRKNSFIEIDPKENLIKVYSDGDKFLTFGNQGSLFV
jgi:hypothetical protein